jgi:uncharacterized protein
MSKMILISLPVRDLNASESFYAGLGGTLNPQFSDDHTKSMMLSEAIVVMLMTHERYGQFIQRPIADAKHSIAAMYALTAESRDAVGEIVDKAVAAGGIADPKPPMDMPFMLNRAIEDPDGNVWEVVWMDMSGQG